jgi:hypothetical protein
MRSLDPAYVAKHLAWHMEHQQIDTSNGPALADVVTLLAERCNTLVEMAAQSRYLFEEYEAIDEAAAKKHLRGVAAEPLALAKTKLAALETWTTEALHELIEATPPSWVRAWARSACRCAWPSPVGPVSCHRCRDGAGGQASGSSPASIAPGVHRSAHGRRVMPVRASPWHRRRRDGAGGQGAGPRRIDAPWRTSKRAWPPNKHRPWHEKGSRTGALRFGLKRICDVKQRHSDEVGGKNS